VQALGLQGPAYRIGLDLPEAGDERARRLPNGDFVRSGGRGGRGTLTIDNGGSRDSVITATKDGRPTFSVYVREGKKYTVSDVSDGGYKLYFTSGVDWDSDARAFSRDCSFQRFQDTMAFRTTRTATHVRWSTWKITLHAVSGGDARTTGVDPGDYPG
jgi:hypothetical protein